MSGFTVRIVSALTCTEDQDIHTVTDFTVSSHRAQMQQACEMQWSSDSEEVFVLTPGEAA